MEASCRSSTAARRSVLELVLPDAPGRIGISSRRAKDGNRNVVKAGDSEGVLVRIRLETRSAGAAGSRGQGPSDRGEGDRGAEEGLGAG